MSIRYDEQSGSLQRADIEGAVALYGAAQRQSRKTAFAGSALAR